MITVTHLFAPEEKSSSVASSAGKYKIHLGEAGHYILYAHREGEEIDIKNFWCQLGRDESVDFTLNKQKMELEPFKYFEESFKSVVLDKASP